MEKVVWERIRCPNIVVNSKVDIRYSFTYYNVYRESTHRQLSASGDRYLRAIAADEAEEKGNQAVNEKPQAMMHATGYLPEVHRTEFEVIQPLPIGFAEDVRDDLMHQSLFIQFHTLPTHNLVDHTDNQCVYAAIGHMLKLHAGPPILTMCFLIWDSYRRRRFRSFFKGVKTGIEDFVKKLL